MGGVLAVNYAQKAQQLVESAQQGRVKFLTFRSRKNINIFLIGLSRLLMERKFLAALTALATLTNQDGHLLATLATPKLIVIAEQLREMHHLSDSERNNFFLLHNTILTSSEALLATHESIKINDKSVFNDLLDCYVYLFTHQFIQAHQLPYFRFFYAQGVLDAASTAPELTNLYELINERFDVLEDEALQDFQRPNCTIEGKFYPLTDNYNYDAPHHAVPCDSIDEIKHHIASFTNNPLITSYMKNIGGQHLFGLALQEFRETIIINNNQSFTLANAVGQMNYYKKNGVICVDLTVSTHGVSQGNNIYYLDEERKLTKAPDPERFQQHIKNKSLFPLYQICVSMELSVNTPMAPFPAKLTTYGNKRRQKVTGPYIAETLEKIANDPKHGKRQALEAATQFMLWSKSKQRKFNFSEVKSFFIKHGAQEMFNSSNQQLQRKISEIKIELGTSELQYCPPALPYQPTTPTPGL